MKNMNEERRVYRIGHIITGEYIVEKRVGEEWVSVDKFGVVASASHRYQTLGEAKDAIDRFITGTRYWTWDQGLGWRDA